jgi:transposase InsO family protein
MVRRLVAPAEAEPEVQPADVVEENDAVSVIDELLDTTMPPEEIPVPVVAPVPPPLIPSGAPYPGSLPQPQPTVIPGQSVLQGGFPVSRSNFQAPLPSCGLPIDGFGVSQEQMVQMMAGMGLNVGMGHLGGPSMSAGVGMQPFPIIAEPELDDSWDTTEVKNYKVRVQVQLAADGTNIRLWDPAFRSACRQAGPDVLRAVCSPSPGTRADEFGRQLLVSCVPQIMALRTESQPNLCAAYRFVKMQYTGGFNFEQNTQWQMEFDTKRMLPTETFEEFVSRKQLLYCCLQANGFPLSPYALAKACFLNLPPQFANAARQLVLHHALATPAHILMMLRLTAEQVGYVEGVGPQAVIPKAAVVQASSSGSGSPLEGFQCHKCGEMGHIRRFCPLNKSGNGAGKGKGKGNRSVAALVTDQDDHGASGSGSEPVPMSLSITQNVYDPNFGGFGRHTWHEDSGATIMLVNQLEYLYEPTYLPEPSPIYLATDAVGGTVAKGSICLKCQDRTLWVDNVHCDPSATQNLFSVSAAIALGFSFESNERGEHVALHGPEGFFCRIVRDRGLYAMEGVNALHLSAPLAMPQNPVLLDTMSPQPVVAAAASAPVENPHGGVPDVTMTASVFMENPSVSVPDAPVPVSVSRTVEVPVPSPFPNTQSEPVETLRQLYHRRMCHLGSQRLDKLIRGQLVQGLPADLALGSPHDTPCSSCVMGKGVRYPFPPSSHKPTRRLELVHVDTAGMFARPGVQLEQYFVIIYDGFTGWREVILVKSKDQIPEQVKHVLVRWMNQTGERIRFLRSDRGREFINRTMREWAESVGIVMQTSCPETPQQNGTAERCVRTIKDGARAILMGVNGPPSLWSDAVQYVAHVSNFLPVEGRKVTPHEGMWGSPPDISNIRVWGCLAYVRVSEKGRGPFAPRYVPGMFVGIDPTVKGWKIRLPGGRTMLSREVIFDETRQGKTDVNSPIIDLDVEQYLGEDVAVWLGEDEELPPSAILFPASGPTAALPESVMPYSPDPELPELVPMDEDLNEAATVSDAAPAPPRRSARLRQAVVTPCRDGRVAISPVNIPAPPLPQLSGPVLVTPTRAEAAATQQAIWDDCQARRHSSTPAGPHPAPSSTPAPSTASLPNAALSPAAEQTADEEGPLTAREQRYINLCKRREEKEAEQRERFAREVAEAERVVAERLGNAQDGSFGIPAHANAFDALSEEGEEVTGEEEVDVTGYTGRGETGMVGGSKGNDTTVWGEDQSGNLGEVDPIARVCVVQRAWIGGPQPQVPGGVKREGPEPKEGLLKVRFQDTPEVRVYERRPEGKRPWERPVSCKRKWKLTPAAKVHRAWREGGHFVGTVRAPLGENGGHILEEITPGEDQWAPHTAGGWDSEDEMEVEGHLAQFRTGGRQEAFQQRMFEQASHQTVFAVIDPEGLQFQVPKTFRQAMQSPQAEYWHRACIDELNSFNEHGTYETVVRRPGMRVLPTHWVFTPKVDGNGVVYRFKARLVVNGDRQQYGVDVNETFAPTATSAARRTLLSMAAALDLEVHQADIKTAFLHGDLEEEVYTMQPPGFGNGNPNVVWRLLKSVYGLKQAPRCWWDKLTKVLAELGFFPTVSDPSIYVNRNEPGQWLYLGVFVDDLAIVGKNRERVMQFKEQLSQIFEIHDLGEIKDFLGASIVRDRENKVLYMRNTAKIDEYVERFGLGGETRPVKVPLSPSFVVTREPHTEVPATEFEPKRVFGSGVPLEAGNPYGELVGCLLYIANSTRPDISTACSVLSQFRAQPTTAHWEEALRVLRYLKDTRMYALRLGGGGEVMEAYVDADYAGCLDTRLSRSGFLIKVMGGVVSWASKKQSTIAQSTVEAEFQAACLAINEVNWLKQYMEELGVQTGEVALYGDNRGCLSHLRNPIVSNHTKHISVRFHKAREAVALGQVTPEYVSTDANTADIFTKALPPTTFLGHREALGVVPVPASLLEGKC